MVLVSCGHAENSEFWTRCKAKMNAVKQMVQWIDGSLGNLLQCQSLDVPQTMIKYGGCVPGGYMSCFGNETCLCKRCTSHWEKYIKLTLQCPHKGAGTLATCEHFPIVPRSTPRDYPPPRQNRPTPDNNTRVQVIETKARQSVSKQELSARIAKEPIKETKPKEPPLEESELPSTDDPGDQKKKEKQPKSIIHTVPLPPDPLESSKEIGEQLEKRRDKLPRNRTSLTRSPDSIAKHTLREKLELHRRSHDQERSKGRKKGNLKEKKVIKKRLKDSDNYVLEQGKIIKRKASFSSSFSALPTVSLFEMPRACLHNGLFLHDTEQEIENISRLLVSAAITRVGNIKKVFAHDDDVFEKIAAEERRAEFFGSSEDLWSAGKREVGSDNEIFNKKKSENDRALDKDMCFELSERRVRSGVWEKDEDKNSKIFISGNSNLKHASSEDSSRIKTSNLSLGSREFLSLKKNRRISKTSKTIRSYSLSKAKDYHKKRAKRTKFATTSESEEVAAGCSSEIDCFSNELTPSLINADQDGLDPKKKRKGKKTPMEFEKRLIAGTKRYYMTKLEKMKSKINIDGNTIFSDAELRSSAAGSGRELSRDESCDPVSLVSIPSQTCRSPLLMMMEGREPGSGLLHQHHKSLSGSKKPSPLMCNGGTGGDDFVPSSNKLRSSSSTPVYSHCGTSTSRPSSCVISISRLKNVRVGPSIKERFCNSLVFIEKPSKPEKSRFLSVNDDNETSSLNDGFAAQLKASKIKLHRELALEERLTPSLTPAWTFSYMPPTSPSYSDYINSVDINCT